MKYRDSKRTARMLYMGKIQHSGGFLFNEIQVKDYPEMVWVIILKHKIDVKGKIFIVLR